MFGSASDGAPPEERGSVPQGPLLVLSPHFDDAALSCAGLLAREEPADVVTVFGGEPDPPRRGPWDERCGFTSSTESLLVRKREEEAAFAKSPHRVSVLELVEGQYLEEARSEADGALLADAVIAWVARNGSGTVALPAAAGRYATPSRFRARLERMARRATGPPPHPDHLFVRDAVLAALDTAETVVPLLYEEFPYLWGGTAEGQAACAATRHGRRAIPLVVTIDRHAKARRIGRYVSQVPHISGHERRVDRAGDLPPVERYWWLIRDDHRREPSA